ncbi:antibiotic biosynthesis monooxygenase [Rosenbergiella epipactidis]|uniref:putative quinol monooxygenase n=2 Tax=Erwiniaceae TaxID=1903409 RepID=UPI0006645396|nr:antibiotic biosynthesis monooxygenase [Tatumella sp. OPLPL6]KMV68124.1 antibiotic biosynthesis monooxygenase [bacteria symbiont BFo2 of Frankliniella occidentalis]MBT0719345.1 antibiotic biosynthesis monooxygenase [Rosenbergiella epipactidis]KYP90471.1 antibiotic biosynthesis monooxygenase [bacteria symbiont BFo2 of Frankliniella occidentalis]KYP94628.1 antibiotic biosynthesis monooxygenase [bacteria symbiont BFo2 of Frankliniella occidentalis]PIJ46451.1 antibiotic biosynthesis monooxygenas
MAGGKGKLMITLSGFLRCRTPEESQTVSHYLPEHQQLSRAEAGCLSFSVTQTADPLVWRVDESFTDNTAFALHQQRVAGSEWGRKTAGIVRDYKMSEG